MGSAIELTHDNMYCLTLDYGTSTHSIAIGWLSMWFRKKNSQIKPILSIRFGRFYDQNSELLIFLHMYGSTHRMRKTDTKNIFASWFSSVGKQTLAWLLFMVAWQSSELAFFVVRASFKVKVAENCPKLVKLRLKNGKRAVLTFSHCQEEQPCQILFPNSQKSWCEVLKPNCFACRWLVIFPDLQSFHSKIIVTCDHGLYYGHITTKTGTTHNVYDLSDFRT